MIWLHKKKQSYLLVGYLGASAADLTQIDVLKQVLLLVCLLQQLLYVDLCGSCLDFRTVNGFAEGGGVSFVG